MFPGKNSAERASKGEPDPLVLLLFAWNSEQDVVTPGGREALLQVAQQELGLPQGHTEFQGPTITILADEIRPHLPRDLKNETMADIFGEVRRRASEEMLVPLAAIRWDVPWRALDSNLSVPGRLVHLGAPDCDEFIWDLLSESNSSFDGPNDLVGETVRSIWKARGGKTFWESAPYEQNWCASQGVFYDLRRMPKFSRAFESDRIEPATLLESLVARREHGALLCSIETRFGVWVGKRAKEGCLPVTCAGILVSPLGLGIAALIVFGLGGMIPGRAAGTLVILLYACFWGIAALLYFRSQPRLPDGITTVKELVREIVRKRRQIGLRKRRVRPIQSVQAKVSG